MTKSYMNNGKQDLIRVPVTKNAYLLYRTTKNKTAISTTGYQTSLYNIITISDLWAEFLPITLEIGFQSHVESYQRFKIV